MTVILRKPLKLLMLVSLVAGASYGVFTQSVLAKSQAVLDCDKAETQSDMNRCASIAYEKADAALNIQYKKTRAALAQQDEDLSSGLVKSTESLLTAQRAWIAYRDAHCETVGFDARGGSLEPYLVSSCLSKLTEQRTAELEALTEEY